jgi:hypothetical protein
MSFFINVDEEQKKAHISITLVVFSVRGVRVPQ